MDNTTSTTPEIEIDLRQALWDLLSQWKALLIVAIAFALLLPGVKYLKDKQEYKEQVVVSVSISAEELEAMTADERIEKALAPLPAGDRALILNLAQQREFVRRENAYLENSLQMSVDPTNQRVLSQRYYVQGSGEFELQPLLDSYSTLFGRSSYCKSLAKALGVNENSDYLHELTSVYSTAVPDSAATSSSLAITVVLPEGASAADARKVVEATLDEYHEELTGVFGEHTLTLVNTEELHRYNKDAADKRITLNNSINSIQNYLKTAVAALTDEQKIAFENVVSILSEKDAKPLDSGEVVTATEEATDGSSEATGTSAADSTASALNAKPTKPSFSKKFAVIGFACGLLVYACVYLAVISLRDRLRNAADLESCIEGRLLGAVYYPQKHRGLFGFLLHSRIVDSIRYRNVGSVSEQIDRVVSTVDSVCKHAGASETLVLRVGIADDQAVKLTDTLLGTLSVPFSVVDMKQTDELEEAVLLDGHHVMLMAQGGTRCADVWRLSQICRNYGVRQLGGVYVDAQ